MRRRFAAWLAVTIGLLNVGMGVASVALAILNGFDALTIIGDPGWILALTCSVVGTVIAARRPKHPIGWIFCAIGFSQGLVSFAYNYAWYALITAPGALPGGGLMSVLGQTAWIPGLNLLITFALLLFPTGRLASPRWRPVAWLSVVPFILWIPFTLAVWPSDER